MPRTARELPPDSVFHLLDRGVERRPIFLEAEDYHFFLTQMKEVFDSFGIGILNFVLMPNHFHFESLTARSPVGAAMQQLLTRYALYFNRKYGRIGHLYQNRFKSFEVRDDAYLVQLPAYISRNPMKAGLASAPDQWEWSGHNEIVSGKKRFLDHSRIEEVTGMSSGRWKESYLEIISKGSPEIAKEAALDEILEYSALVCGISARDLVSGLRGTPFTNARRLFAKEASRRGFLQVDIARALRVSRATVNELLRSQEKGHPC